MKNKYFDLIKEISEKELMISFYFTQILVLSIAFILGIFLFDSFSSFFDLFNWNDPNILFVGGTAGIAVFIIDIILMKILPEAYYDDGGLNERIFEKRSIFQIAIIAAMAAMGEELLFRGVIQTHFGLILSSIIFALVHFRYLFNWFLFINIITLSFVIGLIYLITENIFVPIFMHFLIDFLLGCMINYRYKKRLNEQEGIFNE